MIVGVVGDLHIPFEHPRYLDFIKDTFKKWRVGAVHFIGDVVDQHALSRWTHDPDGMSSGDELKAILARLEDWTRVFNVATVSIGNHDERHLNRARDSGIPSSYMLGLSELFRTPKWTWELQTWIDDVLYEHGTGSSGKFAAYNRALAKRCNLVMGHIHSGGGVLWHTNERDRIFGLNVGCGIDIEQYAFAYGKPSPIRPTLGCGIVIDGVQAMFIPMPISKGEPYRRTARRNNDVGANKKRG